MWDSTVAYALIQVGDESIKVACFACCLSLNVLSLANDLIEMEMVVVVVVVVIYSVERQ